MKRKNVTRSALFTSIISLLLCVSMLVGTTFAWFTDSVSSAKNQIVAGNLDVELEYAKVVDGQMTDWATVAGAEDLFDPNALWEPGRVEVAYLKVTNLGTLALKYQLGINVYGETAGINVAGEEFELSDYLVFKAVEMPDALTTYTDRQAAQLASGGTMGLTDYNGTTTALEVEGIDYVALIVYMPESVGNEANYRGTAPTIELGVNLYATQETYEEDSFGDDYDEDAWHADMTVYTESDLLNALSNNSNFELGSDIELTEAWTPVGTSEEPFTGNIDGNGYTISGLSISAEGNAALIAYAGDNVTIKDLNLENVNVSSNKYAAGVVCSAGTGLTLENITVSGNIEATSYAGGLVMDADKVTIKNCVNNATVSSKRASGVGSWITNATVENVVNNGNITGTIGASGIAEAFSGNMKNATNNGTITSTGSEPASGIAGVQKGASTYEYCVNNGDVTSTADNANASAAGILGQTPGTGATLNYCINNGKIVAEQSYAAGIAYSLYGTITANCCYNSGDVYGADAAGGIAPKAQYGANDTANNCVVDASVTSAGKVYPVSNKVNNSYYYDGEELLDKAGTAVTARAALKNLNAVTGGVFFKVVNGRLEASLQYAWLGDALATPENIQNIINNAEAGDVIVLTAGEYHDAIVMKSGITLQGSEGAVVDCIKLNNADNIAIKNVTVNAAGAQAMINVKGNLQYYANIFNDNASGGDGSTNVLIEGCTFIGKYANGGTAIGTTRQTLTGDSNFTIRNCTFMTEGAYFNIYTYYSGNNGLFVIENNTFKSQFAGGGAIYLGRYQSSVPVVLNNNTFENAVTLDDVFYLQDHSNYGVSYTASGNVFNG